MMGVGGIAGLYNSFIIPAVHHLRGGFCDGGWARKSGCSAGGERAGGDFLLK